MKPIDVEVFKARLLDALKNSDKPLTIGELFLITERSHEIVRKYLHQLQDEGLIENKVMEAHTLIYGNKEVMHMSMHWFPRPVPIPIEPKRKVKI